MANDEKPSNSAQLNLSTARAGIRETAKWVVAASAGVVTLAIGGSSFSTLGSMDFGWRLALAGVSALVGAFLSWRPFSAAVDVLTIRMRALDDIPTDPAFRTVVEKVNKILDRQNPPGLRTAKDVIQAYNDDRTAHYAAVESENNEAIKHAETALTGRLSRVNQLMELCSTEQLVEAFDNLMSRIKRFGPMIVIAFLCFAWAANPAKEASTDLSKPLPTAIAWSAEDEAALIAAGFPKACMTAHHPQLVAVAQRAAMRTSAIAISEISDGACPPVRIDITSAGRLEAPK
jgi:hypothetical protein